MATRDGHIAVLAPEDEQELAERGWASEVRAYHPSSLERLTSPSEAVREPLAALLRDMGVERGPIGYEDGDAYEPVSYAAIYLYGPAVAAVLAAAAPHGQRVSAAGPLTRLRATMTPGEVGQVRVACAIAGSAFAMGTQAVRPGLREPEVAAAFAAPLSVAGRSYTVRR